VELRCRFHAEPPKVDFGLAWKFLEMCKVHAGGRWKDPSRRFVLPASPGILLSEIFSSHAHRVAIHLANHPRDQHAAARHSADT
jgi:hypothetical protein